MVATAGDAVHNPHAHPPILRHPQLRLGHLPALCVSAVPTRFVWPYSLFTSASNDSPRQHHRAFYLLAMTYNCSLLRTPIFDRQRAKPAKLFRPQRRPAWFTRRAARRR